MSHPAAISIWNIFAFSFSTSLTISYAFA
jgi:hypothetical protein